MNNEELKVDDIVFAHEPLRQRRERIKPVQPFLAGKFGHIDIETILLGGRRKTL